VSDSDLLTAIAAGDRGAFGELYGRYARAVLGLALRRIGDPHRAEDATQETFLRVLRYRAKLRAIEDPKPWLARIAWRVAVDRGSKNSRTREVALEDPERPVAEVASSEPSADEIAQGAGVESILEKLIAALPAKLREPLVLSAIQKMSPREVAAALGLSEAAVRSRVFRARQILKAKLVQRASRK